VQQLCVENYGGKLLVHVYNFQTDKYADNIHCV